MADSGDLVARLKGRGLELPSFEAVPTPLGGLGTASGSSSKARGGRARATEEKPVHVPLASLSRETQKLFTPLSELGASALKQETRLKEEGEQDLLASVRETLRSWVQECLARPERREKLLSKGLLKCRVQATWSEGLHEKIKKLVSGYGGRLAADSEKENAAATPAWKLVRTERWLVGFDVKAFELFVQAHPGVLGPSDAKLRARATELRHGCAGAELGAALEDAFGPLHEAVLARAMQAPRDRGGPPAKRAKLGESDHSTADAACAVAMLAPLGLKPKGGAPVLWPPASVALPVLQGLGSLSASPGLQEALRSTSIGKVVNGYRHSGNVEVAQTARALVAAWKATVRK